MEKTGNQILKYAILILGIAVASLFWQTASAQTEISGQLSGSLGPGDFLVTGDIAVTAGETLMIQPGTTLRFTDHYTLTVNGMLIAMGTADDSIRFLPQEPIDEHLWGGIRFLADSPDGNLLSYCIIDHCQNYFYPAFFGGGLYVTGTTVSIDHSTISNCEALDGGGAYITNGATVNFSHCLITDNHAGNGGGILYDPGTSGEILYSSILRNTSNST